MEKDNSNVVSFSSFQKGQLSAEMQESANELSPQEKAAKAEADREALLQRYRDQVYRDFVGVYGEEIARGLADMVEIDDNSQDVTQGAAEEKPDLEPV